MALRFEFFNLTRINAGQPGPGSASTARLVRLVSADPAYIVVHFGPQALGEFAPFDNDQPNLPLTTPVPAVGGRGPTPPLPGPPPTPPHPHPQ